MRCVQILFALALLVNVSCAQTPTPSKQDTAMNLPPNTVRLVATVKAVTKGIVTLHAVEIKGTGQGVVNIIGEGQEIHVRLPEVNYELKAGEKILVDIQEEMGVDASQSTYKLLNIKKTFR